MDWYTLGGSKIKPDVYVTTSGFLISEIQYTALRAKYALVEDSSCKQDLKEGIHSGPPHTFQYYNAVEYSVRCQPFLK